MARKIILEDSGERRHPTLDELYVYGGGLHSAENYEGEWAGKPQDFTILRMARNDFASPDGLTACGDQGLKVDPAVEAAMGPVGASIQAAEALHVVITPSAREKFSLEWAIEKAVETDYPKNWARQYPEVALSTAEQLDNLAVICDQIGSPLAGDCRKQAAKLRADVWHPDCRMVRSGQQSAYCSCGRWECCTNEVTEAEIACSLQNQHLLHLMCHSQEKVNG